MKTIKYICIGFVVLTFLISCGGRDREAKNAEKEVEIALGENDFTKARSNLTKVYSYNRDEFNEKITRAEITYYMKQGEYVRAKAIASEQKAMKSYSEIIANEIPDLILKNDYAIVFNILSNWTFTEDPVYSAEEKNEWQIEELNEKYNSEIGTFNDLVFRLFYAAVTNNNQEYIKKCFLLFQDELVLNTKKTVKTQYADNYYNVTYKKDNKALRKAKKKLAEYERDGKRN